MSTIKVDTIQTRAGASEISITTLKADTIQNTSGTSEIAIDKLKGASSASSISVVGESGTTTTNLQQGLAKAWCHIDGDGTASILDSFNGSSMTDNGTGDYTFTIDNDFASAARRNCAMGTWNSDNRSQGITNATRGMQIYQHSESESAAKIRVNVIYGASGGADGAVFDSGSVYLTLHGDLA